MIATSLITGYRATALSGKPHYMLTRTTVWVEEAVPADNPADAAYDAALKGSDQTPTLTTIDKPCFVLGFADATGPVVLLGGLVVLIAAIWKRQRARRRAVAQIDPGQV